MNRGAVTQKLILFLFLLLYLCPSLKERRVRERACNLIILQEEISVIKKSAHLERK